MEWGIRMLTERPWVAYIGSGVLFSVSFLHSRLWWAVLPATVLLLHTLVTAPTRRRALGRGLVVGTLKALGGTAAIWHIYPLAWLPVAAGAGQLSLIGLYWFFISSVIGFGFAFAGTIFFLLATKYPRFIYMFPFALVVAELLGSAAFALVSSGPGAYGWFHFGFGYAGNALGQSMLFLPFALYAGVYGLTFLCAAIALGAYGVVAPPRVHTARTGWVIIGAAAVLVLVSHAVIAVREPVSVDAIAVETYFTASYQREAAEYAEQRAEVVRAVEKALAYGSPLVVLPEDARFTRSFGTIDDTYSFVDASAETDAIVVDSVRNIDERGKVILRGFIYDTGGLRAYSMDKRYLAPIGEYLPYAVAFVLQAVGADVPVAYMEENQNYHSGVHRAKVEDQLNILFCFESVVPYGVRRIRDSAGRLIVHPVSHAWFHEPYLLRMQLTAMLRIQAVWNDLAILQAGNRADSVLYQNDGSVIPGTVVERNEQWALRRFES